MIEVSPTRNRVSFHQPASGGHIALPIGVPEGRNLLLQGLVRARSEKRGIVRTAIGLLRYMGKHNGAFGSIGGGISVGTSSTKDAQVSWPIVKIDGRLFLRGVDLTDYARPTGSTPPADPA